jgi:hypothetical protein
MISDAGEVEECAGELGEEGGHYTPLGKTDSFWWWTVFHCITCDQECGRRTEIPVVIQLQVTSLHN